MPRWTFCRVDAFWAHFGILPNFECCEVAKKKCHLLSFAGAHHEMFFDNRPYQSTAKTNTFCFSALTSQDHQRLGARKATSQNHQVLRKLLLSRWLHSFLSLTVPSLFLSLLDCSFTVPFFSWRFLCGSFPYLTVRLVFLSSLDFSSLLFKSPYCTSEVSHIDFLWSVSSKEGPQTCANSVFCSLVIKLLRLTPKT